MEDLKGKWNNDKRIERFCIFIFFTILIISGAML